MAVGSFAKYLSGFTSDHVFQTVTVDSETADHKDISLTGMTWDLLNKGYSAVMKGVSNNPFDLDETDKSYLLRKKKQLKFLESKISKISKEHLDFVFLQEVDIFTGSPLPDIVKHFLDTLHKINWRAVHSDKTDNLNMPRLTLYNAAVLKFVSKRPLFAAKSGKFTGLEAEFIHIPTGAKVALTNIYLDHETDHNHDLNAYQDEQIEKGILTIIGGDTHQANGVEYHNLLGDLNMATSVNALKDAEVEEEESEDEIFGGEVDEYA